jgi:hypothetical protein
VVTLSIGITIAPSLKYPFCRVAFDAMDGLEQAKQIDVHKDAVWFLGKSAHWEDFKKYKQLKKEIERIMGTDVSRGFLQKLYGIYRIYSQDAKKYGYKVSQYDDRAGRWRWMLVYMLSREKIHEKEDIQRNVRDNIGFLDVAVRWVELLTRVEEKQEVK